LDAIAAALGDADDKNVREAIKSLVQRNVFRRSDEQDHWQFAHVLAYQFARTEGIATPQMRALLGDWMKASLAASVSGSNSDRGRPLARILEHLAALLRPDREQSLWPLAQFSLYDLSDRLLDLGRLTQVKAALASVEGWFAGLPPEKATQSHWLRERSVLDNRLGHVLGDQGDLAGALVAFRDSLQVRRRLAEADPSNATWQRDLSCTLTSLAKCHDLDGRRDEAIEFAEESLAIDERLAALDPTNATWGKDVEISRALVARLRSAAR
jgi:tetratricopeptide (TPR) repeat protein